MFLSELRGAAASGLIAERCGCASSAPQSDMEDGRNPSIKKSLFPLFSSKNSLKHNSAVKVLPVVASPLVQHQPAAPYPASPVIPPLQLHVDLPSAAFRSSQTSDAWLDFTCFCLWAETVHPLVLLWWMAPVGPACHAYITSVINMFNTQRGALLYPDWIETTVWCEGQNYPAVLRPCSRRLHLDQELSWRWQRSRILMWLTWPGWLHTLLHTLLHVYYKNKKE